MIPRTCTKVLRIKSTLHHHCATFCYLYVLAECSWKTPRITIARENKRFTASSDSRTARYTPQLNLKLKGR